MSVMPISILKFYDNFVLGILVDWEKVFIN